MGSCLLTQPPPPTLPSPPPTSSFCCFSSFKSSVLHWNCPRPPIIQQMLQPNSCESSRVCVCVCVCGNWEVILVVTHRCRSCCLSAGRTSGGSHTLAPYPCHRMCAGSRRFHSCRSLRTTHTRSGFTPRCSSKLAKAR